MTLGSLDITPTNEYERVLSISVMIFGLLFTSALVSSVSATLISSQIRVGEQAQHAHNLELYLKQNRISSLLAYQVRKTATASMRKPYMLTEKDVEALGFLPRALQDDLRVAVFRPHLDRHRMFSVLETLNAGTARELCCEAMEFVLPQADEMLFMPGATSDKAFCIVQGEMLYVQDPNTAPVSQVTSDTVPEGTWLCEAWDVIILCFVFKFVTAKGKYYVFECCGFDVKVFSLRKNNTSTQTCPLESHTELPAARLLFGCTGYMLVAPRVSSRASCLPLMPSI